MTYIKVENSAIVDSGFHRPVAERGVRALYPNTSMPARLSEETLNEHGYFLLHDTPRPTGDVVTQGQPEQGEDGRWRQTWISRDFTPEERSEQLEQRKQERSGEMDAARDDAFAAGLPYDIAGEPDVVQTRPQDQINLLGLSAKAQLLMAGGVTEAVMPFRGLSNTTHMLTPHAMSELALAALAHIESIYQQSWQLKDAVNAAESIEAVEAISWPEV